VFIRVIRGPISFYAGPHPTLSHEYAGEGSERAHATLRFFLLFSTLAFIAPPPIRILPSSVVGMNPTLQISESDNAAKKR
jgi:hypothetical protein